MKLKEILYVLLLAWILTLCIVNGVIPVKTSSIAIKVPQDYPTIQEAINAASAGDTITVAPGTYLESVVINKSVTLIGEDPKTTIIDRGDSVPSHYGYHHDSVIFIIADDVVISGFTIQYTGSGRGIHPSGAPLDIVIRNVTINRNIIKNVETGIMLTYASEIMIINNTIITKNVGIYSDSSTGNIVISKNTIENNKNSGILSSHTGVLIVGNNTIMNNGKGMFIVGRQGGVGELAFSTYRGYPSYWIREDGGGWIINTIYGNLIMNNEYGVYLSVAERANIFYDNNFVKNRKQAYVEDGTNWWDNGVRGNYWSDYKGEDLNDDGVGDVPHIIDANNKDNYPLMNPTTTIPPEEQPALPLTLFIGISVVIAVSMVSIYFTKFRKRRYMTTSSKGHLHTSLKRILNKLCQKKL